MCIYKVWWEHIAFERAFINLKMYGKILESNILMPDIN